MGAKGTRILTGIVLVGLALAAIVALDVRFTASPRPEPAKPAPQVEYYISGVGTASASLTYVTASGGTEQRTQQALPVSIRVGSPAIGAHLYISAQNKTERGCVRVAIVVDHVEAKQAESCGGYAIATTSGVY